ncbi:conserved hypothetical protein [Listeria seeligeri FSL N1-067]|uniref:Uncharacterized protein n=1 Tax=Listeria seeligeri FSL N1-067 TaxID=702453 RepID=E3ZTB0_LISSE|nr:conserved hypothetical protein [Listeria seeligeri FSL N1-067]
MLIIILPEKGTFKRPFISNYNNSIKLLLPKCYLKILRNSEPTSTKK